MNRTLCALLALVTALSFTACGGKGSTTAVSSSAAIAMDQMDMEAAAVAEAAAGMPANTSYNAASGGPMDSAEQPFPEDPSISAGQSALPASRKIIRHMGLRLETQTFDTAVSQLRQIVAEAGGYIEQENIMGRSVHAQQGEAPRSAYWVARIPTEKLDGAVSDLSGICNVLERQENTEDVTERYFDSEAHLRSLKIQEERLLAILEKSEKLEDVVSLEQALSQVRYEIESITAALRRMDSQVAYSYLNINLDEVVTYTPSQELPRTFGQELSASLSISLYRLTDAGKSLLLGLIERGPVFLLTLAVWIVVCFLVLWVVRLVLRLMGVRNRFTLSWRKKPAASPAPSPSSIQPTDSENPPAPPANDKEPPAQ